MKLVTALMVLLLMANLLSAQIYGAIVTDRPDQTESAETVPAGRIQIETGMMLEFDKIETPLVNVETRAYNIAGTLLRYGLTRTIELRLGSEFTYLSNKVAGKEVTTDGLNGVHLGTKVHLMKEDGYMPEFAVLAGADLPVGNSNLVGDDVVPTVLLAAAHTLHDQVGFGYNVGSSMQNGEDLNLIYSAALGVSFNNRLGAFLEFYGDVPAEGETNILFDSGFTLLYRRNIQFDISGGLAINDEAPDWFGSFGLSVRLPK